MEFFFLCFIPVKVSHKLWGSMDGTQVLWLPPWFQSKIKCAYNYDTQCMKFSLTSPSQYLTNKSTPLYNHCAMSYSCLCKSILRLFRPCRMLWHKSFQAKQGGNKKSSKSKVFSSLTWSIKMSWNPFWIQIFIFIYCKVASINACL